ncbi:MAG: zinc metallopeptidase [Oscillospiraceae bacterium]|nr:zinc metallopeptidase [Oscillospiraceae bacterium]
MQYATYGLVILSLIISVAASINVKASFKKWSRVRNSRGLTGAEAARQMLMQHGISNVAIEPIPGSLTDHYDPTSQTIRLSQDVYNSDSVAAVGVAMHEAGHAVQYAQEYAPVKLRHAIVKSTNVSSMVSYLLVVLGIVFSSYNLLTLGIVFFLAVVFFQLVTLPVEFNASIRAVRTLEDSMLLEADERKGAAAVLRAAALTYVAALVTSLLQLLRLLLIRGRRR